MESGWGRAWWRIQRLRGETWGLVAAETICLCVLRWFYAIFARAHCFPSRFCPRKKDAAVDGAKPGVGDRGEASFFLSPRLDSAHPTALDASQSSTSSFGSCFSDPTRRRPAAIGNDGQLLLDFSSSYRSFGPLPRPRSSRQGPVRSGASARVGTGALLLHRDPHNSSHPPPRSARSTPPSSTTNLRSGSSLSSKLCALRTIPPRLPFPNGRSSDRTSRASGWTCCLPSRRSGWRSWG